MQNHAFGMSNITIRFKDTFTIVLGFFERFHASLERLIHQRCVVEKIIL